VQSIAIDKNDNVWLALNEKVNEACLAKIANGQWTLYTSDVLGFQPYYFGNIQFDSKNSLCGAIDYSLSGTAYNDGAQVFIFDGKTARSLEFDNSKDVKFVTVDKHDNIWCGLTDGYAVFNGKKWTVEGSKFKENGVFAIAQSNDGKMWIGTGNGIYINE
jgi:ligand-binding sensor domain-containing protein